jgi:hypothetical protein
VNTAFDSLSYMRMAEDVLSLTSFELKTLCRNTWTFGSRTFLANEKNISKSSSSRETARIVQ